MIGVGWSAGPLVERETLLPAFTQRSKWQLWTWSVKQLNWPICVMVSLKRKKFNQIWNEWLILARNIINMFKCCYKHVRIVSCPQTLDWLEHAVCVTDMQDPTTPPDNGHTTTGNLGRTQAKNFLPIFFFLRQQILIELLISYTVTFLLFF